MAGLSKQASYQMQLVCERQLHLISRVEQYILSVAEWSDALFRHLCSSIMILLLELQGLHSGLRVAEDVRELVLHVHRCLVHM